MTDWTDHSSKTLKPPGDSRLPRREPVWPDEFKMCERWPTATPVVQTKRCYCLLPLAPLVVKSLFRSDADKNAALAEQITTLKKKRTMHPDIATLLRDRDDRARNLVGETPELAVVLSFVSDIIDAFDTFREKNGNPTSASSLRWKINERICQLVGAIAKADCIFIRQLQTDGSVRLIKNESDKSLIVWNAIAPDGCPPEEKEANEGVSGRIINSGSSDPVVITDVRTDPNYGAAHHLSLKKHPPETLEGRFVHKIASEVCIPIWVNGKVVAGIVAVTKRNYADDEYKQIADALKRWQTILAALYFAGLQLERRERLQQTLVQMTHATRLIGEAISDENSLQKFGTVLTCDAGLRWHRVMVFLFEDYYPSSALCVFGLGGDGKSLWFEKQTKVRGWTLAEYFSKTEAADFAADDPLHTLVSTGAVSIGEEEFKSNKGLDRFFMGEREDRVNALFCLPTDAGWIMKMPWFASLFQGPSESDSVCFLVQLIEPSTRMPFGFVLLDNPYRHPVETERNEFLTHLICEHFAAHFSARGLAKGKPGIRRHA